MAIQTKAALQEIGVILLEFYTRALCKHFISIIFITTWITFVLGSGVRLNKQQHTTDVESLYVPVHARSKFEYATIQEHWPINGNRFALGRSFNIRHASQALFRYKDGSSLMDVDTMKRLVDWNQWVTKELHGEDLNQTEHYFDDLCLRWDSKCSFANQHLKTLEIMLERNSTTEITYPNWEIFGFTPLYIGSLLGNVELYNETNQVSSFRSILLIYYLNYLDPKLQHARLDWEKRFAESIESTFIENKTSPFDVSYVHSKSFNNAFTDVTATTASRVVWTVNILIAFGIINCCRLCLKDGRISVDLNGSKPLLGQVGIITSAYGIVTSIGLFLYTGGKGTAISIVIPFLIMSIGLDDTFVILAAWHQADRSLPVPRRMSQCIANSMHSITITSVTSCLSFIIGMLSKLPAVKLFCQGTAMAIFFNYIYQLTFFPAFLYVSGITEAHGIQRILYFLNLPYKGRNDKYNANSWKKQTSSKQMCRVEEDPFAVLIAKYCRTVLQRLAGKLTVLALYLIYIIPAFYGITQLKQGLQFRRLVLQDHHFTKFGRIYFDAFQVGQRVEIAINNAPNLTMACERQRLQSLVNSVEGTEYTMNADATQFFLRDYGDYLRRHDLRRDDVPKVWESGLYSWSTENSYHRAVYPDLAWENSAAGEAKSCRTCDHTLKAFRFRIATLRFKTPDDHRYVAKLVRSLNDQYPEYNITTYNEQWPFVDQFNIILFSTLVSLSTAVASMALVATLFFRDIFCIIWTVLSIISINVGVIGYMSLWGVHLECVSMVCIIMSIGLSVDYTAHVVHGFRVATGSVDERISASFKSLGIPVIQGGVSTLLGVLAIATVQAYLVNVFFKVTTLAVCFGLLHACAFIPVALSSSGHLIDRYCHKGIMATAKSAIASIIINIINSYR